jgi:hypothetical protein
LRFQTVEPIFGDDQFYYVSSGLENGDQLIISAMGVPIQGMKVSPDQESRLDDAAIGGKAISGTKTISGGKAISDKEPVPSGAGGVVSDGK